MVGDMSCKIYDVYLPVHLSKRKVDAVVFGHGLDPMQLSHLTDEYVKLVDSACAHANVTCVTYTARGHGKSLGWETADSYDQFHWKSLAFDMAAVANSCNLQTCTIGGHSMGAGTAIYCAIQQPDMVRAVILVRPPCAWQTRQLRKAQLLDHADGLEQKNDIRYKVIRGAAGTDLPPLQEGGDYFDTYSKIKCPVLILAFKNDAAHPVSTSEQLKLLIPQAKLHVMENEQEAKACWPLIIEQFLKDVYII